MDINPRTNKPYKTHFNQNLEEAYLDLPSIDPVKFRRLGEGRACPSCIDVTTIYFNKTTAKRVAICRICGRTFNA
jgi:hypothetical protein